MAAVARCCAPATPLDWAGDPFDPRLFTWNMASRAIEQTLDHYEDYGDVVGDNPLNLQATTLGLNAYALGAGERFGDWALDYLDAWADRARANGDILPSRVGTRRHGRRRLVARRLWLGIFADRAADRQARGPQPRAARNHCVLDALLLTGDLDYIRLWRRQNARINDAARRSMAGCRRRRCTAPTAGMAGNPVPYRTNGFEIWYATQDPADRAAGRRPPWIAFLEGQDPGYPERALTGDLKLSRIAWPTPGGPH